MSHNPSEILSPIVEDLQRLDQILALLAAEKEFVVRADLAQELVRVVSVIEDVQDRTIYPLIDATDVGSAESLRRSSERVRVAMEPVYATTLHTVPIDVRFDEPVAFDHAVGRLRRAVIGHLIRVESELVKLAHRLREDEAGELVEQLRLARSTALERPRPPHNPVRRLVARAIDKIENGFPDTSVQWRPGLEKLDQPEESVHGER